MHVVWDTAYLTHAECRLRIFRITYELVAIRIRRDRRRDKDLSPGGATQEGKEPKERLVSFSSYLANGARIHPHARRPRDAHQSRAKQAAGRIGQDRL